jgi:hypothetical protein
MADNEKLTLEERIDISKRDEKILRLQKQVSDARIAQEHTRKELHRLRKELEAVRNTREFVFNLTRDEPKPPRWTLGLAGAKKSEHVAVLVASDFQWGEVISEKRMGGVNAFDIKIAQERYKRLIERTIDISFNHLPNNTYAGIIYLRLGDMVSGDIHDDLNESNEAHAIEAVRSLVASELWGIQKLVENFQRVHIISVPGNHGRTTKKPMTKRGAVDNYDTLSAWWLESMLVTHKDISFHTPESGDAFFKLYGRRYLATHGDRIGARGGQGYVGPVATIIRGMKKTFDVCAGMHMPIDKMFIGHFHTSYELDYGWANGCLTGYSELARDGRMKPEEPCQWLIFFHRKYGATSRWKIRLAPEPAVPKHEEKKPFQMEG